MSFVSLEFAILFSVVVPLYFVIPHRNRWILLLISSYIFYMAWKAQYVLLILLTTVCDYFLAKAIFNATDQRQRKVFLSLSVSLNLSILFVFKYFNFFNASLVEVFQGLGLDYSVGSLSLLLPVGISFYTFQEMGYVIDVYRGKIKPEERFGIFALFVSFFPQLVSGPIERAGNMLPQYHALVCFDQARVVEGLRMILWGVFKKVVIADRLAIYVNDVYGHPHEYNGPVFAVATVFFAFQIYCDFSGYSDIAIGTARVLGFKLMDNFRQPYFASSVREFWRRWHISLSTWFRDYLYIPLGGSRVTAVRHQFNLMAVFLICGLWHGASWTFVIWGLLHGLFLISESRFAPWDTENQPAISGTRSGVFLYFVRVGLTFVMVCFTWIFFRAQTLSDALYIVTHLLTIPDGPLGITRPFGTDGPLDEFIIAGLLIALLLIVDVIDARWGINRILHASPMVLRWSYYYAASAGILMLGIWGRQEFIYFQF